MISGGQCAGGGGTYTLREKQVDGFIEAALENMLEGREGDVPSVWNVLAKRKMEAVNGVEEELSANAFVEVGALAPEAIERRRFASEDG